MNNKPMLNAYPDSIGSKLADMIAFLSNPEVTDTFSSFYILPSIFNTDLDRGFSVIDYEINELFAAPEDLVKLNELGIDLKLDFILNHLSVLSEPFQDILKNGRQSKYADFFIDWNKFWEGNGTMTEEGYIQPEPALIEKMFFRKPGLPILMVRMPDGREVPYWNTFYQEVKYDPVDAQDLMKACDIQYSLASVLAGLINQAIAAEQKPTEIEFGELAKYRTDVIEFMEKRRKYLGQMDLNIESPLVWQYYDETLKKLHQYGASIVRLDAFAYAPKTPGRENFMNEPDTWDLLEKVQQLADQYQLTLLPEIHTSYRDKTYEVLAGKGYMTYDFFLPGLIIDAIERNTPVVISRWIEEVLAKQIKTINMLGCHDGIPLLDLEGMISQQQIEDLIGIIVDRGGHVKNLHGAENVYYQVNATYYSALGEDDRKMLFARVLQLFMPGKPQIWYLDLLAGTNDYEAFAQAGAGGHKEINRTNLTLEAALERLDNKLVRDQLELLRFRNTFAAFDFDARISQQQEENGLKISWEFAGAKAVAELDFHSYDFTVTGYQEDGTVTFAMNSGK